MWRMNASASIQNSSTSGHCTPRRQYAQNTSREKRTCSVSVGVNAVKSWVPDQSAGARAQQRQIDPVGPVQRPPALERARAPPASAPGSSTPARSHPAGRRNPANPPARTTAPRRPRAAARSATAPTPAAPRSWPPAPRRGRRRRSARRPSRARRQRPQHDARAPLDLVLDRPSAALGAPSPRTPPRRTRSAAGCAPHRRITRSARPARAEPSRSSLTGAARASGSGCSRRAARCSAERSPRTACRR